MTVKETFLAVLHAQMLVELRFWSAKSEKSELRTVAPIDIARHKSYPQEIRYIFWDLVAGHPIPLLHHVILSLTSTDHPFVGSLIPNDGWTIPRNW